MRRPIDFFYDICSIPHASYHTEKLADYLVDFAISHSLKYRRDEAGNVVIFKPASKGREDEPALILQGHIDMVAEKEADISLDMEKEAISVFEDGDFLRAKGTTLGADDGAAVAIMLAVLDDDSVSAPALECVFTADEEVGLLGADALDLTDLKGRRLLNLDSEQEGIFTAGCAGGMDVVCRLPVKRKLYNGIALKITVEGLLGGHSGEMIGRGRANAALLSGRLMRMIHNTVAPFHLAQISSGGKDNAIPRSADIKLLFPLSCDKESILSAVKGFEETIRNEYALADPDIRIHAEFESYLYNENGMPAMTGKSTKRIISFLNTVPNGVVEYTQGFDALPQTSLNLGILNTEETTVEAVSLVRSSIDSQKFYIAEKVGMIGRMHKAEVTFGSGYPAWPYRKDSGFRKMLCEIYKEVTGKEAGVTITHGGLECGIFCGKLPDLDCVSAGPDMYDIHTPKEHLSLSSFDRTCTFIKRVLETRSFV